MFQEIKEKGILPNLFYEISITLKAHLTKTLQENKGANQYPS